MTVVIRVGTTIPAAPGDVWQVIEPIASHVDWMTDAESIELLSDPPLGVGTTFRAVTRVGPIALDDELRVTRWEPGSVMGIAHEGLVTGRGEFRLTETDAGTRFSWEEELRFPWWLGGPIGELVARPVLAAIWRGNLRRLRGLVGRRVAAR